MFPSVTYLDLDRRAKQFFDDVAGVEEIISANAVDDGPRSFAFLAGDYQADFGLEDESFDLLISLYAGFISEHCTRCLRIGGGFSSTPATETPRWHPLTIATH